MPDQVAPPIQLPDPRESRAFDRTGRSAVERLAVLAVARDVAAMPASLVVQLAVWPDDLAHWARSERLSESLVYNTLAARKPYTRVRQLLATRLDVPVAVIAQLIDARRPLAAVQREPGAPGPSPDPSVDWTTPPFPPARDGGNPIERRAVRAVGRDVAAMPASTVAGLTMWPETLTAWSRAQRLATSVVWATMAGAPSERVRDLLARRLGVSVRELGVLIDGRRAAPAAAHSWSADLASHERLLTTVLADADADPVAPASPASADALTGALTEASAAARGATASDADRPAPAPSRARRTRPSPPDDQIGLEL